VNCWCGAVEGTQPFDDMTHSAACELSREALRLHEAPTDD